MHPGRVCARVRAGVGIPTQVEVPMTCMMFWSAMFQYHTFRHLYKLNGTESKEVSR